MKRIYVSHLPEETTQAVLQWLFSPCGEVVDVFLPKDSAPQSSRGVAFVEFATPEQAQAALALNGREFKGRALQISLASKRRSDTLANQGG